MRIRIAARPGELAARADEVRREIERLLSDDLCKASVGGQIDQVPKKLDYPALQGSVDRAAEQAKRIRDVMLSKLLAAIGQ
jgi:hypothetical protein